MRRTQRLLLAARSARSVAQGILVVDFALYLKALHWTGASIGLVLAGGMIFAVALTIAASAASDRIGRKPFLIGFDLMYALACVAALLTPTAAVLAVAAIAGAFGRGANGAAGPFGSIERAWLAQDLDAATRAELMTRNATLGFLGMAAGAVLAIVPGLLTTATPDAGAYRPIFGIALAAALVCLGCVAMAEDRHVALGPAVDVPSDRALRQRENRDLKRLALANFMQGSGIGLTGPLIAYWFAIRFGVGPRHIAPLLATGFLLAAISSQLSAPLVRRHGVMRVIVALRLGGLALLLAFPFAPNLAAAVGIYLLRSALNRATNGPRSTIMTGLVRNQRLGTAGMIASVARQLPRSVGPVLAGLLFDSGMLVAPFLVGAAFQAGYLWLYQRSFGSVGAHPRGHLSVR